jgi:hypothetical protein
MRSLGPRTDPSTQRRPHDFEETSTSVDVHLLIEGFSSLVAEMRTSPSAAEAA